ncbi:hypothetical protein GCM10012279_29810 [Micromonospora yangpuensis]|nr:hypothetical protein GCM10012279_29810 [Micromonospora yangpuensis]
MLARATVGSMVTRSPTVNVWGLLMADALLNGVSATDAEERESRAGQIRAGHGEDLAHVDGREVLLVCP